MGESEEVDQQFVMFEVAVKEATVEQIPRAEKKRKQKWMPEDISDLIKKESEKEKKQRVQPRRSGSMKMSRNIEKNLWKFLERKPAHLKDDLRQKTVTLL